MERNDIEIMAPVGSFESLMAAIQAGADSVYFGVGSLNMRSASSVNFTANDMAKIVEIAHNNNVKTYLTLNTIIYDDDIPQMQKSIDLAHQNGVDAIIASDYAVINYSQKYKIPIHCSTQLNISNTSSIKYYAQFAEVIVLARELNLSQIKTICDNIQKHNITTPSGKPLRIEIFAHGALCMAVSGKCYLSLDLYNRSANRGECSQICRRGYDVARMIYTATEEDKNYELEIDNKYIMSPKDLCTIDFLDKIIGTGINVLKIEGRGRSPEYVKRVVECYNIAVNSIINGDYTNELILDLKNRLSEVFNRGFWSGYYLGQTLGEWSEQHSSSATKVKEFIGICTNYFGNIKVAEFLIQTGNINVGDDILIIGNTTGVLELQVTELHNDFGIVKTANKGERFSIRTSDKVRKNDKIYKIVNKNT